MKKIYILLIVLFAYNASINAQLKISNVGNVAIETNPSPADYIKLLVNFSSTAGDGVNWNYSIAGINNIHTSVTPALVHFGTYGSAYCSTAKSASQAYGVYGQAGNVTNGFNYGVYGKLIGSNNGAGVYGASRTKGAMNTAGDWAGFFNGNVRITDNLTLGRIPTAVYIYSDTIYYNYLARYSDQRLKKNISTITNAFDKISQLNAVEYYYKSKQELISDGVIPPEIINTTLPDTSVIDSTTIIGINNTINSRKQYGFIAQELQQVYPELVFEKEDGLLSIDYVSFIAIIVETIKEQNDKINNLELQLNNCCKSSINEHQLKLGTNESTSGTENKKLKQSALLYQNSPNPFTTETQIKCFIPDNAKNAQLNIYNMQGTQLKKHLINRTGEVNIEINAYEFTAGMYLYALIVDGKEIDVKRMILTD